MVLTNITNFMYVMFTICLWAPVLASPSGIGNSLSQSIKDTHLQAFRTLAGSTLVHLELEIVCLGLSRIHIYQHLDFGSVQEVLMEGDCSYLN